MQSSQTQIRDINNHEEMMKSSDSNPIDMSLTYLHLANGLDDYPLLYHSTWNMNLLLKYIIVSTILAVVIGILGTNADITEFQQHYLRSKNFIADHMWPVFTWSHSSDKQRADIFEELSNHN